VYPYMRTGGRTDHVSVGGTDKFERVEGRCFEDSLEGS
jgi:hypothetical protein